MNIKILGTSCPNCKRLEKLTAEVVSENNFNAEISKVEDITQIMSYGIMRTPALVFDEKVVVSGRVPSKDEVKNLINKHING